ncbi:MaoC family dehydratase [Nakamurella sp. YIM 132087]|uniref:MaoC family dehydratase n=1 Tax=Nakamurella alba TaxID=2665158 RepID=A0A7K1FEF9_9ACTN|nr:MaoC family dehydratase [Nakamurella alba]MTD12460.1 MaoC family dehydratase [Nakamurella alba]
MRIVDGVQDLEDLLGQELGTSGWHTVDQSLITAFAHATDDFEAIHLDPGRGIEAGLGGTIAHGLYTLALGPKFLYEIFEVRGHRLGLNYGFDRVRFTAPVTVGSRVRMSATLVRAAPLDGGTRFTIRQRFEIEGRERPACVADALVAYFR